MATYRALIEFEVDEEGLIFTGLYETIDEICLAADTQRAKLIVVEPFNLDGEID